MKGKIKFNTQYYFPNRIVWGGGSFGFALGLFAAGYVWGSVVGGIIFLLSISTRYGVEIDFDKKKFQEFIWILGYQHGERVPFDAIQYLFLKDFRIAQTFNSRVNSATVIEDEFRGYVKFSEENKVHILTMDDYDKLVGKLKPLAAKFKVGLMDYTFGHRIQLM